MVFGPVAINGLILPGFACAPPGFAVSAFSKLRYQRLGVGRYLCSLLAAAVRKSKQASTPIME
jgi:hypothetical protein